MRPSTVRPPATVKLLPEPESAAILRTGAVASVQEAQISIPRSALEPLWRSDHLERLARSYWRFLARVSLGLLRVVYAPDSRAVVLVAPPLRLLVFHPPEYVTKQSFGEVTWRIRRGLLVAREGVDNGFLQIRIWREGADPTSSERELVGVRVEVQNYYPWLRGGGRFARIGTRLYELTQLRIHVLVTRGFLRSLARFELPVGRDAASRYGAGWRLGGDAREHEL
jgi:hypothetical protein